MSVGSRLLLSQHHHQPILWLIMFLSLFILTVLPESEAVVSLSSCCLPAAQCAPHYLSSLYSPSSSCLLAPDTPGLCCPPYHQSCQSLLTSTPPQDSCCRYQERTSPASREPARLRVSASV